MLIVNYKAYEKAVGEGAEEITEEIEDGAPEDTEVVVAPQTADLNRIDTGEEKFAQHIDPVETGSHTGSNQVKAVKDSGVAGTLINHSERRLEDKEIQDVIRKCREENLTTVVCAQTPEECGRYSKYNPDYIAFEPPELIGGDTAVSSAEPRLIEKAVERSGEVDTLTGAGIKSREDVERSVELGCKGILVASGVIKSEDVEEEVKELCRGL
jgi:triosephosphate isomerase